MGGRMAKNLLTKSKQPLVVYDKVADACKEVKTLGAKVASTPRGVAEQADVIITMLRADDQGIFFFFLKKKEDINNNVKKDALLIDSSTVNYLTTKLEASQSLGTHFVVFGRTWEQKKKKKKKAAEAGSLTFMCGGPKTSFEHAEKVLKYMGAKIFHCGEQPGSGQIVKICNNLILAISMDAVSEGMNLGVKLGLFIRFVEHFFLSSGTIGIDANKLAEIVNVSSGRCWSSDTYNPCPGVFPKVPSSNQYKGGFAIDLMRKDLQLALQAAHSVNASTPLGINVKQLYDMISTRGHGDKDFSFLYQFVKGTEMVIFSTSLHFSCNQIQSTYPVCKNITLKQNIRNIKIFKSMI
ncbi:3-hydroxyisobutyrate dehydrogenase [Reticulomyxa filosa]|uniref:3-hydroxyisobutyrate dehydrogenase n=1 Tax=Reticulomyxa filosa TaxID=46433 RepID=X6P2P4_RETFI|nr:3-hydroxyisobutyrate dehydrogenase [Reticulomyxa filosa]|eukprot:ETO32354.1 3-hydroxyisobutyrate dehydrogenase [Reticulomyxa filosa]